MGRFTITVQFVLALSTGLTNVQGHPSIRESHGQSPSIVCQYSDEWQSCNTPLTRDCWVRKKSSQGLNQSVPQFDVLTDCEQLRFTLQIMHS
jgi:hypothetical protein